MQTVTSHEEGYPFKIVPFFLDFAFKIAYGEDSAFSRHAIELLVDLDAPIIYLELIRNEFEGSTLEGRSGIYDVIYRDERLRVFILEMQKKALRQLASRLMFYDFHYFNSMVAKGKFGFENIPPVACICLLEDNFFPEKDIYVWKFQFSDLLNKKVLSDKAQVHLVELGKFPILQQDWKKVSTDKEKLFYTMKYAHLINPGNPAEVPDFFAEPWLKEVLGKLTLANLTPEQRVMLDFSIMRYRMDKEEKLADLKEEFEKGEIAGEKRGEKRGEQNTIHVLQLHLMGRVPAKDIAEKLKLPLKEVLTILRKFEKSKPKK